MSFHRTRFYEAFVDFVTKRVYDDPGPEDGVRILVDGLWPRGMKKEKAPIDLWLKEVAPSADVRNAFRDAPDRWDTFVKAYHKELDVNEQIVNQLLEVAKKGRVTLLYAKKDTEHNNAVALQRYLASRGR